MPIFEYIAISPNGEKKKGTIDAFDKKQVVRRMTRQGLSLVSISLEDSNIKDEKKEDDFFADNDKNLEDHPDLHKKKAFGPHKVGKSFLEKLYSLLQSGLPAGDAIKLLGQRVMDPALKALCLKFWRDLSEGLSLANAMSRFPEVFSKSDIHLVEAGEASGSLTLVIERLVEYYNSKEILAAKIKSAMAYPIVIIGLAISVIILFCTYLMPKLQDMMEKLGGEMNTLTSILVFLSEAIIIVGPILFLILLIIFFYLKNLRKTSEGLQETDNYLLKTPLISPILQDIEASRMASLLATLMENGLNTPEALKLAEKSSGNVIIQKRIAAAKILISDGASFTNAFKKHKVLPLIDLDILSVGESTGSLPKAFAQIAKTHEKSLDASLKKLIVVLSSVFLGTTVAIVFLALLSIVMMILNVSQSAGQ